MEAFPPVIDATVEDPSQANLLLRMKRSENMISIVCVFNDHQILDRFLLRSLHRQTAPYELHLVDNTDNGKFASAAEALNYGAREATGDYIMFVHQDISLTEIDWLERMESIIKTLPALGIAGVAGKKDRGKVIGNVEYPNYIPKVFDEFVEPTKVQTLDECVIIVPKTVFEQYRFDENTCPDWHLYAVEYCLRLKLRDLNSYSVPHYVYHKAGPSSNDWLSNKVKYLPESYYSTLKLILDKYKSDYQTIYTTCGVWNTHIPIRIQRLKIWGYIKEHTHALYTLIFKPDKFANLSGVFIRTKPGQLLMPRIISEYNAPDIDKWVRIRTHETLKSELITRNQTEIDVLTANEINEHLTTLRILTRELNLKRVLELGVCEGKSTIAFLQAIKEIGGHVTSIDIEDCPIAREKVHDEKSGHLWNFIKEDDIEIEWNQPIDHLFIDTSHTYDHTVLELRKFAPFIVPGGLITLHDTVSFPGVRKAVTEFIKENPRMRYYNYYHNNGLAVIRC